ncbi:MAG: MoaD/ThiS family protein [Planctomycetes bacterium]|nr:MoaD/ThiS family protein [Planctomycetota bacterium]
MPKVELARHLYAFFPHLEGKEINVQAESAADVVKEMEKLAPGFAFYICDERGSLRTHVNMFIEENMVSDRKKLSDRVKPDSKVYILQALSGG